MTLAIAHEVKAELYAGPLPEGLLPPRLEVVMQAWSAQHWGTSREVRVAWGIRHPRRKP